MILICAWEYANTTFLNHSHVAGLTLPLVDIETFTVHSTFIFMIHDHHLVYCEGDIPQIFIKSPLVAGLTLPLVDTETSRYDFCHTHPHYYSFMHNDPHLRLGIRRTQFLYHFLTSPALHYRWLTPRLPLCLAHLLSWIMTLMLSTVEETCNQFLELLYLVTGLTLPLVDAHIFSPTRAWPCRGVGA